MSKYTTEVRYICETANGLGESKGYADIDTIITNAIPKIFTFTFPIFDENYRTVLEKKILKHFYTREICEETVGLWKLRLDTKLNEIMPYYNKLYKSELLEFNPLYTANLTRTKKTDYDSNRNENENISDTSSSNRTTTNNGNVNNTTTNNGTVNNTTSNNGEVNTKNNSKTTGTGSGTSNNTRTDLYSDTPQGSLSGVESNTYLTNARKITDNGSTNSNTSNTNSSTANVESSESGTNNTTTSDNGTNNTTTSDNGTDNSTGTYGRIRGNTDALTSTEDYLETVVGYDGASGSDLLLKFRETFLNIDVMILNELEDLFFQLW